MNYNFIMYNELLKKLREVPSWVASSNRFDFTHL